MGTSAVTGFRGLAQLNRGFVSSAFRIRGREGAAGIVTRVADLGDLSCLVAHRKRRDGPVQRTYASGTGLDDQEALRLALAEALERYAASIWRPEDFVVASQAELGGAALDLETIARCSARELTRPDCPLIKPDNRAHLRWVRSIALEDGKTVFLPAVCVYLNIGYAFPGERIWWPLSTGCAIHEDYERAVLNAALEVVERDALTIAWLQRLPLPRIEIDSVPPELAAAWTCYQAGLKEIEYLFFDATTDVGTPVVYGVRRARASEWGRMAVACAADLNPARAVAKVIRDLTALSTAFREPRAAPETAEACQGIMDGALYMAQAARESAFDFLTKAPATRPLTKMPNLSQPDDRASLRLILRKLTALGMKAYAVDLTTDETVRAGCRAVRVFIPDLQPLSFHYRARYLGHPRLYKAPGRMGYRAVQEEHLNKWPQPFA
jgi:ribosomal protein S12 methylthiotransferase accessory factor